MVTLGKTLNTADQDGTLFTADEQGFLSFLKQMIPLSQIWQHLSKCFSQYRPNVVFNSLHGEIENSGQLQGFFSTLSIPFTGNNLYSSVIGMDKILSKNIFKSLGITTPKGLYLGYLDKIIDIEGILSNVLRKGFEFPLIVKATHGSSSEGIAYINNLNEFHNIIKEWVNIFSIKCYPIFIEEFIAGNEYCLGIFGNSLRGENLTILPVAEVCYP